MYENFSTNDLSNINSIEEAFENINANLETAILNYKKIRDNKKLTSRTLQEINNIISLCK
jgi:hypothetical protein